MYYSSHNSMLQAATAIAVLLLHFMWCVQDVTEVVNTCHEAGISKLAVKMRPIAVIKG